MEFGEAATVGAGGCCGGEKSGTPSFGTILLKKNLKLLCMNKNKQKTPTRSEQ